MKLFPWREDVLEVASASQKPCGARGGHCASTLPLPSCCQIPPGVGVLWKYLEKVPGGKMRHRLVQLAKIGAGHPLR